MLHLPREQTTHHLAVTSPRLSSPVLIISTTRSHHKTRDHNPALFLLIIAVPPLCPSCHPPRLPLLLCSVCRPMRLPCAKLSITAVPLTVNASQSPSSNSPSAHPIKSLPTSSHSPTPSMSSIISLHTCHHSLSPSPFLDRIEANDAV
jgi:hypothetical protein